MSAIRPYVKPPTRREPEPQAPKPMTPNAAWLDSAAAYWQAQEGVTLVWHWDGLFGGYMGFTVAAAGRGLIARVWLYE